MDFFKLLFSFEGRISRSRWWLGFVALMIVTVSVMLALNPGILTAPVDQPLPPPSLLELLFGMASVIPATALTVKRFNDRDHPNWWGYALGGLAAIFTAAPSFGYLHDPLFYSKAEMAITAVFLLIALVVFIDNGFLKGTSGPNRYGPDPLAK